MGIPDHLTCLLRNLYVSQEATVRTGHGTTDWFQIGKGVRPGSMLSPDLLLYLFFCRILELWCWRRLLRVPWTAWRSSKSSLKEISPGISLEGMMLRLKLQYFGHLMRRVDSMEKTLMLEGIGGRRRRGRQRMSWLDGITDSMDVGLGELRELVMNNGTCMPRFMGSQRVDMSERLN